MARRLKTAPGPTDSFIDQAVEIPLGDGDVLAAQRRQPAQRPRP